ncbi:hypothetical protein P7C71_g4176, partial [Lecanoromycetidae sp. Uapishka_2]
MPSSCPSWDASVVLKTDPDAPGFTCVGYAPSQGRRCHNRIAAANRQEASKLLDRISRRNPSSSRIEDLLESLAPLLLCKRYHQNQADFMVQKWNERIEDFGDAETAREEAREKRRKQKAREKRLAERLEEMEAARDEALERKRKQKARARRMEERLAKAEAARDEARERTNAAQEARESSNARSEVIEQFNEPANLTEALLNATRTLTALSHVIEATRTTLSNDASLPLSPATSSPSSGAISIASPASTERSAESVIALVAAAEALIEQGQEHVRQQSSDEHVEANLVSSVTNQARSNAIAQQEDAQRETLPNTENSATASIHSAPSQEVPTGEEDDDDDEEDDDDDDDEDEDDEDEDDEDEDEDDEEENHTGDRRRIEGDCSICCEDLTNEEALVWCEAQCGQNYHRECINKWLGTDEQHTKTCPYCRANWIE